MGTLETARTLSYGIMVPVLFFTSFLVYRRNLSLATFFGIQSMVYLIHLLVLFFFPDDSAATGMNWEPLYSGLIVAQAIAATSIIIREFRMRRQLRGILGDLEYYSQEHLQEEKSMGKFQIPGVLPVALILLLPPAIIPVITQFFPTNTYWWSALLVVVLNVVVIVVRISWPDESTKVPMPMSQGAPNDVPQHGTPERSMMSKIMLGV